MNSKTNHNYIIILAGGSGTRLWPMSTDKNPKQIKRIVTEESLLEHMYTLVTNSIPPERVILVAPEKYGDHIKAQLPSLPHKNILFEPSKRDNGPAIILGVSEIYRRDPQAHIMVVWSDHYIAHRHIFTEMLNTGFRESHLHPETLFVVGTRPLSADTSLGYIGLTRKISKQSIVEVADVNAFIEKPGPRKAQSLFKSRKYLWNIGYKIFSAKHFLSDIKRIHRAYTHHIDILATLPITPAEKEIFDDTYRDLPAKSIEYLYTEHVKNIKAVIADLGWSDVGTWNSLHALLKEHGSSDVISRGNVTHIDTKNTLIIGHDRRVATLGVEGLIIVVTGDTILIASKDCAHDVKKLIPLE